MEPAITAQLDASRLDALASRWGIEGGSLEVLGDFENFVYACEIDGRPRIFRISHGSHRGPESVRAELDWIEHLAGAGLQVARPVPSIGGEMVESLDAGDGYRFTAAAFERAPGERAGPEDWTPEFYREWGRTVARMHAATRGYARGFADSPGRVRHRWDENPYITEVAALLPAGEDAELVRDRLAEIVERLSALPTGRADIGLIHEDLHAGNFHLHEGKLIAFDFDDCCYHWWVNDLAVVLYYALWNPLSADDREGFARHFLDHLVEGYREILPIEDEALAQIPLFLKLRELLLFIVTQAKWAPGTQTDGQRAFIDRYRERIRDRKPYVALGRWDEEFRG